MSNLISPIDCKHRHTSSLQGGSCISTEEHSRYNIYLCLDCGQFMVRGMMNGEHYSINFTLIRREDLEAAGKAVAYYNEEDEPIDPLDIDDYFDFERA